jgi:heptosyltransferase-2
VAAPARILVIRAGALGDTLMATPALRALRNRYPEAELDFLCSPAARPLLAANPCITRLFTLRQRHVPHWLSPEKWRLARELRNRRYDLAVVLESTDAYHDLARRAGAARILSIRDTFDPALHSVANNLRAAGFEGQAVPPMELPVAAADAERAASLLGPLPRPRIGLHAGYGPPRRKDRVQQSERLKGWGAENFARLAQRLRAQHRASLVITGGHGDLPEAARIAAQAGPPEPLVLAGRTSVGELAAVIAQLDLLVSVDSGPAHMAAALRTPLVVLWGPAILEQVQPLGDPARIRLLRHPVFCAPCYGTPMMKTCRRNICMEAISPQRVAKEVESLLTTIPISGKT